MATGLTLQQFSTVVESDINTIWNGNGTDTTTNTLYTNLAGVQATDLGISIQNIEKDMGTINTAETTNATDITTLQGDFTTINTTTYTLVTDQTGNTPAGGAAGTTVSGYANVVQAIDNDITNIDALAGSTVSYTSPITGT